MSQNDEGMWLELGLAHLGGSRWAAAAEALEKAVALDGTLLAGRVGWARALSELGRLDEAVFQLVRAKRLMPHDARVARELGMAFYDKRLFRKAQTELKRSLSLSDGDARAHFALGLVCDQLGEQVHAMACYRAAVALRPYWIDARRTLADALTATGELDGAIAELEAALASNGSSAGSIAGSIAGAVISENLTLLRRARSEQHAERLLGHDADQIAQSALVGRGKLVHLGRLTGDGGRTAYGISVERFGDEHTRLTAMIGHDGRIERLELVLLDAKQAAARDGAVFCVTSLSTSGTPMACDYATAIHLTFLREALGFSMTEAGKLYTKLCAQTESLIHDGARLGFADMTIEGDAHHGLFVERCALVEAP